MTSGSSHLYQLATPLMITTLNAILLLRVQWTLKKYISLMQYICVSLSYVQLLNPLIHDPIAYIPPGSSVHGIFWARILEWVAISSSRGSSQPRDRTCISCTGRQILYHRATWKTQAIYLIKIKQWPFSLGGRNMDVFFHFSTFLHF